MKTNRYSKSFKESRWMNLIRKINIYLINVKRTMKKNAYELYQNLNQIPVDDDSIFIESFHGKILVEILNILLLLLRTV